MTAPRLLIDPNQWAPPLVKPEGSHTERFYNDLLQFVLNGTEDCSMGRFYPVSDVGKQHKFTWAMITGRPGEGKSRIVREVARQLSRRDIFGSLKKQREHSDNFIGRLKIRFFDPSESLKPKKQRALALTAWFREYFPLTARNVGEFGDPWDTGYLRDSKIDELKQWAPRKPTLIILDDPPYGDAAEVIELLTERSTSFQRPVRLFAVNQTVSSQLYLLYEQYKDKHANINIVIKQSAGFTTAHIGAVRQFVHAYKKPEQSLPQLQRDKDYKKLLEVTNGNVLLLELAIPLLLNGLPLYQLSEEKILENRVAAVLRKLEDQGLGENGIKALIVATIADGPTYDNWTQALQQQLQLASEAIPSIKAISQVFPYSQKTKRLLRYRKKTRAEEFIQEPPRVPVLRPDLIADQLINRILADHGDHLGQQIAKQLVSAAWASNNSRGTMRSAERWLAKGNHFISDAFKQSLSPEFFINPTDYLMAVTELVLFHQSPYETLLDALKKVSISEVDNYLEKLTGILKTPGINRLAMIRWVNNIFESLKTQTTNDYSLTLDLLKLATQCFNRLYTKHHGQAFDQLITQLIVGLIDVLVLHKQALFKENLAVLDALVEAISIQEAKGQPLLNELLKSVSDLPWRSGAKAWLLWCQMRNTWAVCLADEIKTNPARKPELDQHITQLSNELVDDTHDAELIAQWVRAKGLEVRYYCRSPEGTNAEQAEKIAENIDEWTQRFPGQQEVIDKQRVWIWKNVIYAYSQIPSGKAAEKCEALAQRVDQIAAHFPDYHENIQEQRAVSWRFVISAYCQIPSGKAAEKCEVLAQRVDQIAAHFPDDHENIQEQRAVSWCYVIYAYNQKPSGQGAEKCEVLAQRVDQIAAHFPDDHENIQEQRAKSWSHVIYAYCRIPSGEAAKKCEMLAQRVVQIAAHFPDDHENIQKQRAASWRFVISAYCQIPSGKAAEKCEVLAQRVDQIAAHFPDNHENIQKQRAESWRYVIYAYRKIPSGKAAKKCEMLAQRVDQIAAHFPDDHETIQEQRAESWSHVIYAYCRIPSGEPAKKCEMLAQRVDQIAAHFPDDHENIQKQRAASWRFVISAYCQIPSGKAAKKCEMLAQRVDQIAAHFPDNHENIQIERAQSWSYVIYAYRQIPSGEAAEKCEALAQRVDQITAHFPVDHETMQRHRSRSWYWVCQAFSDKQPANFQKNKMQQAIDIVLSIGQRFPHNASIQEDVQRAMKLMSKMDM